MIRIIKQFKNFFLIKFSLYTKLIISQPIITIKLYQKEKNFVLKTFQRVININKLRENFSWLLNF